MTPVFATSMPIPDRVQDAMREAMMADIPRQFRAGKPQVGGAREYTGPRKDADRYQIERKRLRPHIENLSAAGMSMTKIAEHFKISRTTVSRILQEAS